MCKSLISCKKGGNTVSVIFISFSRVNCYNILRTTCPFGGFKKSGIGREL